MPELHAASKRREMIKRTLLSCAVLCGLLLTGCSEKEELKVISFNVRYDNPADSPNSWPDRAGFVAEYLLGQKPDLLGMQEVLLHQYEFLREKLAGYNSIGVGRTDGMKDGEMCPVFYRTDRFEAVEDGTFWLSETPDVPGSKGPGAVLPRIVTWVQLKEIASGRKLYFFNTHFSHVSDSARIMGAMILGGAVKQIAGDHFFVVTGDFNLRPDSRAYETLTGEGAPWHILYDTWLMSETPPSGADYTFNGFSDKPGNGRIDYIFVPAGTRVLSHETIIAKRDSLFISDHWPVKVILSW
jgi:endonuclease/exonuclease/phosphatase family metal-dependent hydrolase